MPASLTTAHPDAKRVATLLATHAATFRAGVQNYYRDLVRRTPMPSSWQLERAGGWSGDASYDARELISWALAKGTNPQIRNWSTLGALLRTLLEDESLGLGDSSFVLAVIDVHHMCLDEAARESLRLLYGIPQYPHRESLVDDSAVKDEGPDFVWRGPTDHLELQAFFKKEPDLLDVDFLARGIECAGAVCRISIPKLDRTATGFLVGTGLVLTNYHVLRYRPDESLSENARRTTVRFQRSTSGAESTATTYTLDPGEPIVFESSALDCLLLRIEPGFQEETAGNKWVAPALLSPHPPSDGSGVHILQHPHGTTMKLAISNNGVTGVYEGDGLLQYVTNVAPGSSGAPCFDDDWQVVALHHGARSKPFGRVGEGILMARVRQQIENLL